MSECSAGRLGVLEVSADAGTTWVRLGHVVDANININIDELECTSHDSDGARTYHPNFHDVTIDGSARWSDGDAGQNIVALAVFSKTTFRCRFRLTTGEGDKFFEAGAFATTWNASAPLDDTAMIEFTLRLSGAIMDYQATDDGP